MRRGVERTEKRRSGEEPEEPEVPEETRGRVSVCVGV